MATDAADYSV